MGITFFQINFELNKVLQAQSYRLEYTLKTLREEISRNIRSLSDAYPHFRYGSDSPLLLRPEEQLHIIERRLGEIEAQLCTICPESVKPSILGLSWQVDRSAQRILSLAKKIRIKTEAMGTEETKRRETLKNISWIASKPAAKKRPALKQFMRGAFELRNDPESDTNSSPHLPINLLESGTVVIALPPALVDETKSAAAIAAAAVA